MIEMLAMRYIIMTQKDRKVEEILFDHEHEDVFNMDLRKTKKQSMTEEVMFSFNDIQYRRREFRLKKRLNMALYLVISISIVFFIIKLLSKLTISSIFIVYNKYMKFNYFKSIYFLMVLSINFLKKNYINKC